MNDIKKKVKAVIFDMDGTIINTEHVWRNVTLKVLQEQCNLTDFQEEHEFFLKSLSGMGLKSAADAMRSAFNLAIPTEDLIKRKIEIADSLFDASIEYIKGFEVFHKRLQEEIIPTSIATNADPSNLKHIAAALNFERFFGSNMYCIGDVGFRAKPDPAVFLHAAERLGAKPEECVVFEDSLYGFQAAKAAGMQCVAIKNNLNKDHLGLVAQAIDDYSQAEDALKKIITS
ncbi:MAG: HAD-superfamily hydrolase, subfamily IA, variant 3 [candidate division TM6 bacterium GW2011_GWF2_38_10]|nr:MAG: HAD-superfamily hydrolase, subfamily IA, variant 3 [candidate division TM6 bacterium GW2011_GWF2_38_10]